jgi:hypothetical protein
VVIAASFISSSPLPRRHAVRSQLYVALDAGYLDKASFDPLIQQAEEVARIVGGLRSSVQRQKADGGK